MKNKLVVIGMPRGSTTYLYHNLNKHPFIYCPFRKEVNYFNVNYKKGEDWYNSLFAEQREDQASVDVSPPCFMDPKSDQRISDYSADTKVLLIVRDPVEWALSFYHQFASFNYNMMPFEEFVNGYDYKVGTEYLHVTFKENYVVKRIQQICDHFGDNLLVCHQSVIKDSPLTLLQAIEQHLGVPSYFTDDNFTKQKINASGRANFVWLSWLLSRESVIAVIGKIFSRNLVLKVRGMFDMFSSDKVKEIKDPRSQKDIDFAKETFADQQAWVDNFFRQGRLLYGTGRPYPVQPDVNHKSTASS